MRLGGIRGWFFVVGVVMLGATMAPAEDAVPPRFMGAWLPEPPAQEKPWAHQKEPWSDAADVLFKLGLADPRGCEYRKATLVLGDRWSGGSLARDHVWVLPGSCGGRRFGIWWDGLVYPLVGVGGPAPLDLDIEKRVATNRVPGNMFLNDETQIALLLRLGRISVARSMAHDLGDISEDQLGLLARGWVNAMLDRAVCGLMRGDDRLSLIDARLLRKLLPKLNSDLAGRTKGFRPDGLLVSNGREVLEQVFRDVNRRIYSQRRSKAPAGSIEALIGDLENLDSRVMFDSDTMLEYDPRVLRIVKCGNAAVEPLIRTVAHDDRLTRAAIASSGYLRGWDLVTVSEVAHRALEMILRQEFRTRDSEGRAIPRSEDVHRIEGYWAAVKKIPLWERLYRVLRDDRAGADAWASAADNICAPNGVIRIGGTIYGDMELKKGQKPSGEILRRHSSPSVAELLIRRSDQLAASSHGRDQEMLNTAAYLALDALRWDPPTGKAVGLRRLRDIGAFRGRSKGANRDSYLQDVAQTLRQALNKARTGLVG